MNRQITVRLPDEMFDRLERVAAADRRRIGDCTRLLLEDALDRRLGADASTPEVAA